MGTKQRIVGVKELRENLEEYISEVGKGKTFTVVRRSKPVFKISPVDEYGDEGDWKTIIDFTKIKKGGVPAKDVLKAIKLLNENGKDTKIFK